MKGFNGEDAANKHRLGGCETQNKMAYPALFQRKHPHFVGTECYWVSDEHFISETQASEWGDRMWLTLVRLLKDRGVEV